MNYSSSLCSVSHEFVSTAKGSQNQLPTLLSICRALSSRSAEWAYFNYTQQYALDHIINIIIGHILEVLRAVTVRPMSAMAECCQSRQATRDLAAFWWLADRRQDSDKRQATSLVDGCFQLILITTLTYLSCFRYKQ